MNLKPTVMPASVPRKRRRQPRPRQPMDWLALEALRLTAAAFRRCGYSSTQLATRFRSFVDQPQRPVRSSKRGGWTQLHDPGHVLTLWSSDPQYVDDIGLPRPLAIRGSAPSIEALVKRVKPKLRLEHAMRGLLGTGSILKVGRRYVPAGEFVHHVAQGTQSAHHLLVLYQLVRNFEFNSHAKLGEDTWPQRVAECPDFPAHELPSLIAALNRRITSFVHAEDKTMSRIARAAPAAAPRLRPAVNLFVSVFDPLTERTRSKRAHRSNKATRSGEPT